MDQPFGDEAIELAWAAGFLDGEGNFRCSHGIHKGKYPRITLEFSAAQVPREPLDRLAAVLGGRVNGPYKSNKPNKQPYHRWSMQAYQECKKTMFRLLPYVCSIKRDQMLNAWSDFLEYQAQRKGF
jgi:hypothetical protein